jgi:hypothetical protein
VEDVEGRMWAHPPLASVRVPRARHGSLAMAGSAPIHGY